MKAEKRCPECQLYECICRAEYKEIKAGKSITWHVIKTTNFGEIWIPDNLLKRIAKLAKKAFGE